MALYPARLDEGPRPAGDIEIIQVTDDAGVDDHVRTAAAGFELPEAILREIMSTKTANDPDLALYVGYAGGQPVTTGLGLRTGPTIGVYNISTVPAARGRGYGAAMTRRVANDGVRAGCDAAILQASEMGRPIYERLGYRTVVQYLGFGEPQRS
jgi:GNAT superfamily N-acetyltransferase